MARDSPSKDDFFEKTQSRLGRAELTVADNRALIERLRELVPVYRHDRSYFVVGSYGRGPMRRLTLVSDRLNRRPNSYAFRMVDIRGDWENSIQKFCLIADLVTAIVGVAEEEPSDFLVEQGILTGRREYFEKSYVLKRTYEESPYGWMQRGVFNLLEEENRLFGWSTEEELLRLIERIP